MKRITYDSIGDIAYVKYNNKPIVISKEIDDNIVIDLDQNDEIVGVEIFTASRYGKNKNISGGGINKTEIEKIVAKHIE